MSIAPGAEWRQMFREAWRLQRDHFWTPDMSDVDWLAVYERYLPLVDRANSRSEFSDLIWEMQGELGTSHSYEFGGDYRPPPRYDQGHLGVDYEYVAESDTWRITHIVKGDAWDEMTSSPLNGPGINVERCRPSAGNQRSHARPLGLAGRCAGESCRRGRDVVDCR